MAPIAVVRSSVVLPPILAPVIRASDAQRAPPSAMSLGTQFNSAGLRSATNSSRPPSIVSAASSLRSSRIVVVVVVVVVVVIVVVVVSHCARQSGPTLCIASAATASDCSTSSSASARTARRNDGAVSIPRRVSFIIVYCLFVFVLVVINNTYDFDKPCSRNAA